MLSKKYASLCSAAFFSICLYVPVFAQTITTAGDYFKTVSDFYALIRDYEADMDVSMGNRQMKAHVSFKRPDLLRIDFSKPAEQVVLFNGDLLTIYLPGSSAVLQQSVQSSSAGGASLATSQGLSLMSRYYTIKYEIGQEPVTLDDTSDERVIKLVFDRRNTTEAFRSIRIAINAETKLIRRIAATTPQGEEYVFTFSDYKVNQDIPDQRFIYDPPSSANVYNDFLLSE